MLGLNLNNNINYGFCGMRYFKKDECHVKRKCKDDVLLLVFDGILRFSEDGVETEVSPGQYYIQKHGSLQDGKIKSDSPKYLYVHFYADWTRDENRLNKRGRFNYALLKPLMEKLDNLEFNKAPYLNKASVFYNILLELVPKSNTLSLANKVAEHINNNLDLPFNLDEISLKFNFSKNHIINNFKKEFKITPNAYYNMQKIKKAEYLITATSDSLEQIAYTCGYNSYSYFYKQFIKINNKTPEQFRNSSRLNG